MSQMFKRAFSERDNNKFISLDKKRLTSERNGICVEEYLSDALLMTDISMEEYVRKRIRIQTRSIVAGVPNAKELSELPKHGNRSRDRRHYVHLQIDPDVREQKNDAMDMDKYNCHDTNEITQLGNDELIIKGVFRHQFGSVKVFAPKPIH